MESFQTSESIVEFSKALLEFQKLEISVVKNTENKFLKNKYADLGAYLEVLRPALNKSGLVLSQFPINNELITQVTHAESGQFFRSSMPITLTGKTAQEIGSQISYFRRYSIASIFGLYADDDDDGNAASNVTSEKPTKWLNMNGPEWKTIKDKYNSVAEVQKDFLLAKSTITELEKLFN
jgi:hypothetical protein